MPTTKPMVDLRELARKSGDAGLPREMIGFAAERLREVEVGSRTGAAGALGDEGFARRSGSPSKRRATAEAVAQSVGRHHNVREDSEPRARGPKDRWSAPHERRDYR